MRAWRIHFAWAIVTALAAAVSARMAAPPQAETPARPSATSAAATSPPPAPAPDDAPKSAAPAVAEVPVASAAPSESDFVAKVRSLLKDPNSWAEIQKLAADASRRDAILAVLKELLNDQNINVQFNAVATLVFLKGSEAARMIEGYLAVHLHQADGTASNAANALGEVGDLRSIPILKEALREKEDETRLSAALALQKLGFGGPAGDIMAEMTLLFESADGALRRKAIETIARLQPESAMPMFARALRDSNGDVRLQAIWALSNLGRRDVMPLLQPLANDPNPEVAKEASQALENLKSQEQ